jgi:hypothetical protein
MLLSLLLLPFAQLAPAESSLLATVPDDAYVLAHCRDVAALRARAESNDWYRLLGSPHGEPFLSGLAHEFRSVTHSGMEELLAMAGALEGEVVFFDTGKVAGFVAEPPADRAELAVLVRDWMPSGDAAARRTVQLAGGTVELSAWPDQIDGWSGRAGHLAAFVDHPRALAIYSGDDSAAVMAALTEGFTGLGSDARRAPLVSSYLASGGDQSGGIELFIDFTPFVGQAEAALKDAVEGLLPDPSKLLGLEDGTWLHASADVFRGATVEFRARLRLPPDTLSARLADTFKPLPNTLPVDLPEGAWALYALNWDLKLFYQRARAAYEEANRTEGLVRVDGGIEAAKGFADVDPIVDILNLLAGDFALYLVEPAKQERDSGLRGLEEMLMLGFYAGLVDGDTFLAAFEKLFDAGHLESVFDLQEIAGVDAYIGRDDDFDGGVAFLPRAFSVAPSRSVLERGLKALTRVEGASVQHGSLMRAAIDESAGACFISCVEMTPLRIYMLPEMKGDLRLPPLEEGQDARDPFDSQLISTARRTPDGFEFRLHTR